MVSPIQRGAGVPEAGRATGLGERLSLKVETPEGFIDSGWWGRDRHFLQWSSGKGSL